MGLVRTRVHKDHTWGKHPWKSDNPEGSDREFSPKREADMKDVSMCLSCPVPQKKCHGLGHCYNEETGEYVKKQFRSDMRKDCRRVSFDMERFLTALRQTRDNKELAKMFGVSTPTIRKWRDFAGVPRGSKDVFEIPEEGGEEESVRKER